jgi:hypothetical protein
MATFDPFGAATLNTSPAFYECWECPEWCPPDPWEPIILS